MGGGETFASKGECKSGHRAMRRGLSWGGGAVDSSTSVAGGNHEAQPEATC